MEKTSSMWFCDTCGKAITKAENGWVEWIEYKVSEDEYKGRNFRLVHAGSKGCQFNEKEERKKDGGMISDMPLKHFLGQDGLMYLLSKIAQGIIPTSEVLEMIKRLHISGYEIARKHFERALKKGIIETEIYPGFYSQQDIAEVIKQNWPDDINAQRTKKPNLNLKDGFTKDNLKQLLSSCDDMEGHHIIWVDWNGNIDIALLPSDITPAGWAEEMKDKVKFRYETLVKGNEYVGFEAARSQKYVDELYKDLKNDWKKNRTGYIDYSE